MTTTGDHEARALQAAAVALRPVAQAVADALSQTTEVVVEALRWGGARFGRLADVAGGLIADPLYAWRVANRVRLWQRLQHVRLPAGAIPNGWAAKVLTSAEETEDDELLDMWARLLLAGAEERHRHPGYVQVVRSLSPAEARFLRETYHRGYVHNVHSSQPDDGPDPDHQHFISLGVAGYSLLPQLESRGGDPYGSDMENHLTYIHSIYVTDFGAGLCEALGVERRESSAH